MRFYNRGFSNLYDVFAIRYTFIFDVPFDKKDIAKARKFRWNADIKKWYKDIKCNGLIDDVISEFEVEIGRITPFKIINIYSNAFDDKIFPEQKEQLLKYYDENFKNKDKIEQEEEKEREINYYKRLKKKEEKKRREEEEEIKRLEEEFEKL